MLLTSIASAMRLISKFNRQKTIQNAYRAICSLRTVGVRTIAEYIKVKEQYHAEERRKAKAEKILPENIRIKIPNTFKQSCELYQEQIKNIGEILFYMLDEWQGLGGTFKELCTLCNISESKGRQIIEELAEDEWEFSKMIFVYNLDYKEKGDFIIDTSNAPLTICIKEYMIYIMMNTARGRKASHEALQAVCSELWGDDIILSTSDGGFQYKDENGEIHHIDKDGVEI